MALIAFLKNGKVFIGTDYNDLVLSLAHPLAENKLEYMAGVASRCEMWDGTELKYTNPEEFVKELLRIGIIEKLVIKGGRV